MVLYINRVKCCRKKNVQWKRQGKADIHISSESKEICMAFHVPAYADNYCIMAGGKKMQADIRDGYAYVDGILGDMDIL